MRIVLLPADMCSRGSNGLRRVAHAREDGRRARSRRLRREYRHAEGESVDDPLRRFFGLSRIFRKRHPFANDFSAHFVFIHVAGSLTVIVAYIERCGPESGASSALSDHWNRNGHTIADNLSCPASLVADQNAR
jgi:hypothetical protein